MTANRCWSYLLFEAYCLAPDAKKDCPLKREGNVHPDCLCLPEMRKIKVIGVSTIAEIVDGKIRPCKHLCLGNCTKEFEEAGLGEVMDKYHDKMEKATKKRKK